MPDWKEIARRVGVQLEEGFDSRRMDVRDRSARVTVLPFRSYGTPGRLQVIGRVLTERLVTEAPAGGSAWANLVATFRRLASDKVAGARIGVTDGEFSVQVVSDEEGYFHATVPTSDVLDEWHRVAIQPIDPPGELAFADVLVPAATARFGVISDIDDTIVETNATSLVALAKAVFLHDASGRIPMEGVAGFYAALRAGATGDERNPLFYVSSSPWNFYDLLIEFLDLNAIVVGPLMLQDYGFDEVKLIHAAHDDHKVEQIEEILATYPALTFVLIGDSGQRDPEIYQTIATLHPERIAAIFIRDVTTAARDEAVRAIAERITALGIPMHLIEKTSEAFDHAKELGLII